MKLLSRVEYRYRCFKEEVGAFVEFNFVRAARQANRSFLRQLWEVLWGWVRYGLLPKSYYNYRMFEDKSPLRKKVRAYVSDRAYFSRLGRVNLKYSLLLNSKWVFHNFYEKHNVPLPKCWGYFHKNGGIWAQTSETFSFEDLPKYFRELDGQKIIVKPNGGSSGFLITVADVVWEANECFLIVKGNKIPLEEFALRFKKHDYIIEERLRQHEVLDQIFAKAVNTVRIVTLNDTRNVLVWGAIIKIGTKDADIDNWGKGSLCVGIDLETGQMTNGKYDVCYTKSIEPPLLVHPDTDAPIAGVALPMWEELKETVKKASMLAPGLPYIAWDVAITPDGPCIIEGNGRSDLSMVQVQGGLLNPEIRKWWQQFDIKIS